jgi:hypothetical protein
MGRKSLWVEEAANNHIAIFDAHATKNICVHSVGIFREALWHRLGKATV